MANSNKLLACILLFVAAALAIPTAVYAVASPTSGRDPLRSVVISKEEAASRFVRTLQANTTSSDQSASASTVADAPTTVGDPIDGALETVYEVDSVYGAGFVDVHSGRVVGMTYLANIPSGKDVNVSDQQAQQIASGFLASQGIPTTGLADTVTLVDHGDSKEYVVEWTGTVNGALVPDNRRVSVNPTTGAVVGYDDNRHPYAAPPAPEVTQARALAAGISRAGRNANATAVASLAITFALSGQQHLTWQVEVTNYTPTPAGSSYQGTRDETEVAVDAADGTTSVSQ